MAPHIHYDPDNTASYAADKSTIRTLLCLAAASGTPLRHIDISSAFTAERYAYEKPVYVRQIHQFDGTLKYPDRPIGKLNLNLYGSKPASHIYFTGLTAHLQKHGFAALHSDPCVFTKKTINGTITAGVTTDDFLVSAPTDNLIDTFTATLKKNIPYGTWALRRNISAGQFAGKHTGLYTYHSLP